MNYFEKAHIHGFESSSGEKWWSFSCAMIGRCRPIFDDCGSNYDVARRLKDAGVITDEMEEDSEMCTFCVYFKSEELANIFIQNLNDYLQQWERQVTIRLDPEQALLVPYLQSLMKVAYRSCEAYVDMSDEETFVLLEEAHSISNGIFSELENKGYVIDENGWPVEHTESDS